MSIKSDLTEAIELRFELAVSDWLEEYASPIKEDYGYDYRDKDIRRARDEIKEILLDIINEL